MKAYMIIDPKGDFEFKRVFRSWSHALFTALDLEAVWRLNGVEVHLEILEVYHA